MIFPNLGSHFSTKGQTSENVVFMQYARGSPSSTGSETGKGRIVKPEASGWLHSVTAES